MRLLILQADCPSLSPSLLMPGHICVPCGPVDAVIGAGIPQALLQVWCLRLAHFRRLLYDPAVGLEPSRSSGLIDAAPQLTPPLTILWKPPCRPRYLAKLRLDGLDTHRPNRH